MIGNVVAKSLTTGALFVSAVLSWPIFLDFMAGDAEATVVPVLKWVESGGMTFDWPLRVDARPAAIRVVAPTWPALGPPHGWGSRAEDDAQPRSLPNPRRSTL